MPAALAPVQTTASPPVRTCKWGHRVEGHNAQRVKSGTGAYYVACRQCRYDAVKRVKARQRGEDVPLQGPVPTIRKQPPFQTIELWKALGVPLRQRVAGVLMDDTPPDPLFSAVVRRCAHRRVVRYLGAHFAAISLVEALIEECRDSARLEIDEVLAELLR